MIDREAHERRRRARWLLTVGTGTIAGAIVGLGAWQLASSASCDAGERLYVPGLGAASLGAAGAGILGAGILRARALPPADRRSRPVRGGRLAGVIAGALLTTAISSVVPLAIGSRQWLRCAGD